jgi:hypothetical protein
MNHFLFSFLLGIFLKKKQKFITKWLKFAFISVS